MLAAYNFEESSVATFTAIGATHQSQRLASLLAAARIILVGLSLHFLTFSAVAWQSNLSAPPKVPAGVPGIAC
jgi:hypothetical protein